MPYIEREGKIRLHYELDDYTDPWRNAPYLLLQHGFGRASKFWYSWVPYLSRHFKVIRPDLRGLGKSTATLEPGANVGEIFIDDLNAIITTLGAESVHYCGEALGGTLGAALAATYPERIRTLTLVSSPVYLSKREKETTTYGHASRIESMKKMGVRAWAEASNSGRRFPPETDQGLLRWYVDQMGESSLDVLIAISTWLEDFSAVPYLGKVQAPVLGLYAANGPIIDNEQLSLLKAQLRNFRFVRVPSEYQAIQNFKPATCANEVLHFAAQHDGFCCHE